jgi:hypothetical protein
MDGEASLGFTDKEVAYEHVKFTDRRSIGSPGIVVKSLYEDQIKC